MAALRFDKDGFRRDITAAFQKAVQDFTTKLTMEMEAAKPAPPSPGIPPIIIIKRDAEVIGWHIVAHVMALGGWAVASEFGTGSAMETNNLINPSLSRYINSDLWNPARPRQAGAPIVGRPRGRWKDIFGRDRYSRGTAEGRNLENKNRYRPIKGTAWFRAIFILNQRNFHRRCVQILKQFPMHRYIISDTRR